MPALHAKYATAMLLVICSLASSALGQERTATPPAQAQELARPKYLRKTEASVQIDQALLEAAHTGRNVMLVVGGEWCPWCETLHRFFEQQPELAQKSEHNFVTVHVYYGSDDKNENALARYPKVLSVPHFFVLSQKGMLLDSKSMEELEDANKPSVAKFREFLMKWTSAAANQAAK